MGTPTIRVYMITKEKFDKWKNSNLYMVRKFYDDVLFVTKQEAIQEIEKHSKEYGDGNTFDQLLKEWENNGSEDEFFQEYDFFSYKHFFERDTVFSFMESVVCECGVPHVIFGYTGW